MRRNRNSIKKSYSLLEQNGIIINADQVHGETSFIETLNKKIWKHYVENSGLSEEEILAGYERTKLDKDSTLDQQINWLKEAGFFLMLVAYINSINLQ